MDAVENGRDFGQRGKEPKVGRSALFARVTQKKAREAGGGMPSVREGGGGGGRRGGLHNLKGEKARKKHKQKT